MYFTLTLFYLTDDITLRYPFFFRPMFEVLENGWQAFSPETEFNRFKECSEDWRISYVNKDYKVSNFILSVVRHHTFVTCYFFLILLSRYWLKAIMLGKLIGEFNEPFLAMANIELVKLYC